MSNSFAATSLVWVNGQVTIPKYVLDVLGVHSGHHESVTFIIEGDTVEFLLASSLVPAPSSLAFFHVASLVAR